MRARSKIRYLKREKQRLDEEVRRMKKDACEAVADERPLPEGMSLSEKDWRETPRAVQMLIVQMAGDMQLRREEVKQLRMENEKLHEQLRTNSRNSSKPPSSDPPSTAGKEQKRNKPDGRKPGGQPGHEGKTRELLPVEQCDEVVDCKPQERCECGGKVGPAEGEPERHQVLEIPAIKPEVTEYRMFAGICEDCGRHFRCVLPPGVPNGMLGPRAMGITSLFSGKFRLSKRNIEEMLADILGTTICLGTVSNVEDRVSEAIEKPVEEAREFIQEQDVVNMDETGWKEENKKAWLWTAVTSCVAVFVIRLSRSAEVAREILGEAFKGILVSDRYSSYNWVDALRRQLCWSHLIRDFVKISERSGQSAKIGTELLEYARKMFGLWHKVRDGPLDRHAFQVAMEPIRQKIENLLEQGASCGHKKTQQTCKRILKLKAALWTFVDVPGVEPTNNVAERTVRPGVLWRKQSFGTQSKRGSQFVERMLTVSATCKLQGRNVLEYLVEAIEAHLRGQTAPSLLPLEATVEQAQAA